MVLNVLQNYKTVTGSVILLASLALQQAGVAVDQAKVAEVVGAALTIVGWVHKIIKARRASQKNTLSVEK